MFGEYPAAHRQPTHLGHCFLIHGHNYSFEVTFSAETLDHNGFILDFGKMDFIKNYFKENFDHTFLADPRDPVLGDIEALNISKLVLVEGGTSAESLSKKVFTDLNKLVEEATNSRVKVTSVKCFEDSKNSSTYYYD
jgi:6-pyruvoyltetrahydropterin/6-carboxytetrahydropterin synthase